MEEAIRESAETISFLLEKINVCSRPQSPSIVLYASQSVSKGYIVMF